MDGMDAMTEAEFAEWLRQSDEDYAALEAERKRKEREALRAFDFRQCQFNMRREAYRKAIGA